MQINYGTQAQWWVNFFVIAATRKKYDVFCRLSKNMKLIHFKTSDWS